MPISTPATRALDQLNLPYRLFEHSRLPTSLKEAARHRGEDPAQVIRSILFRVQPEVFVMVLMAGPGQISWKRVRAHLGVSRLSMATETEVHQFTGYETGTVNPLGLPHPIRILVNESVFQPDEISIGCGVRGAAIILRSADLREALGQVEIGIFSQP